MVNKQTPPEASYSFLQRISSAMMEGTRLQASSQTRKSALVLVAFSTGQQRHFESLIVAQEAHFALEVTDFCRIFLQ